MSITLDTLTESMRADIEDLLPSSDDHHDLAHEVADGAIPICAYQLIKLVTSEPDLLTDEPEVLAADWFPPALRIVVGNLYEKLYAIAVEIIEELEIANV